ncbi:MAG: hypothetical protein OEX00_05065, partial [Gammaproteobacteria bacterium]|nr:hypothetical protein [Gammaproteobacteria bacterium]
RAITAIALANLFIKNSLYLPGLVVVLFYRPQLDNIIDTECGICNTQDLLSPYKQSLYQI